MRFLKEEEIKFYVEIYGPILLGIFASFLGYSFIEKFNIAVDDLEKVLNLIITMTTVIVGFIGVLLGIIATIKEKPIMKTFWRVNNGVARRTLKSYFMSSLHSGAFLVFYSIGLPIVIKTGMVEKTWLRFFEILWCFCCGYSIGSSYRRISFIMMVLFSEDIEEEKSKSKNKITQFDQEIIDLKKRHARKD